MHANHLDRLGAHFGRWPVDRSCSGRLIADIGGRQEMTCFSTLCVGKTDGANNTMFVAILISRASSRDEQSISIFNKESSPLRRAVMSFVEEGSMPTVRMANLRCAPRGCTCSRSGIEHDCFFPFGADCKALCRRLVNGLLHRRQPRVRLGW